MHCNLMPPTVVPMVLRFNYKAPTMKPIIYSFLSGSKVANLEATSLTYNVVLDTVEPQLREK